MPDLSDREEKALRFKHVQHFVQSGSHHKVGVYNLLPPTRTCTNNLCSWRRGQHGAAIAKPLSRASNYEVTVFTKELGAVPGIASSWYCDSCSTRYHHNFYVHSDATTRTYYLEPPVAVQVAQHYYITSDLLELFRTMMVTSWTSFTNCSRTYNSGLAKNIIDVNSSLPIDWPCSFQLQPEHVADGFFLYALILEYHERYLSKPSEQAPDFLMLAHNDTQRNRLDQALEARNRLMAGPGQEAWNHACNECCWIDPSDNTFIRSTVTDGITIGHPCCGVHDCTNDLPTNKSRFCVEHQSQNRLCCVVDCENAVRAPFRTCNQDSHRAIESHLLLRGKAMFQLKKRLERLHTSQTHDSMVGSSQTTAEEVPEGTGIEDDQDFDMQEDGLCDGKSEQGNTRPRARFGRRWTHNEQLCVGSCGVILGRATFYGSEAPNGVRHFWMRLFPTRQSLPQVLWHDNNCRIMAMLNKDNNPELKGYFDACALPVDVFHFKCKHKASDKQCNQNCNPALWEDLQTPDGQWRFNSSAAEQTNVWMGGFQAIVREMTRIRYNFFLDEMIKWRNRMLIEELRRKGKAPHSIPRELLLPRA